MKFETKTIHAGIKPDGTSGSVMTPIYQTATYAQEAPGKHKGYEYARTKNPTRDALQDNLMALENGVGAVCFSSGLAAMDAILKTLKSGDEIISTNDLYGGSYRQIETIYGQFGLKGYFIDMELLSNVEEKITEKTQLIWIETPTNPLLKIIDIAAICDLVKGRGIKVCVDNTFASPFLQQPLELGADYALHSATKYLGGHSDVVHGAVVCKHNDDLEKLLYIQNASGAVPGPMDCFLILRGIKTLHLRMERVSENAMKLARFLETNPKIGKVYYPGLETHPGHALAKKQMRDFGGMLSFDLKSGEMQDAVKFMSETKLFILAESLGGVESLVGHPASMTHGSIPREDRIKAGLGDTLIRLSVGVEHIDDLIQDVGGVLDKI